MRRATESFVDWVRNQLASEPVRRALAQLRVGEAREPDVRALYSELGRLGLLAVNWPEECGGRGRTLLDAASVVQELVRAGVPDTLHVNTIQIVGLFLLLAGTAEQKSRYLPAFARGEAFACVLYTEPGSGSDLASLRATAVAEGNGYRLRGTKVFSLKSDIADVGLAALRTSQHNSPYAGITLFLVDMRAAGVHRTSIPSIADEQFHRVEFRDVYVPREAVIGNVGEGWPLLSTALAIERTGLDYVLKAERWLAAAIDDSGDESRDRGLAADIGRYSGEIEAARALTWRILGQLETGKVTEVLSAAAKYFSSELAQEIALWAARVHGSTYSARGLPPPNRRVLEAAFREAPGLTFSAGTSEMMLQIVAGPVLDGRANDERDDPDAMDTQLRGTFRDALASVARPVDPHETPAVHGAESPAWELLRRLNALQLELPAEADGLDLGVHSAAIVLEELGRAAMGSPCAGAMLALHALRTQGRLVGSELTSLLTEGALVVALAGFDVESVSGVGSAGVYRLSGRVVANADADLFLLPVRTHESTVLVGLRRERLATVPTSLPDGQALLVLDGTHAEQGDLFGVLDEEDAVLTAAWIRQAAYLAGIAGGALAAAIRYANQRTQFGEPLRAFQSLAFRLADAHVRLEALRSLVYCVARGLDDGERVALRARQALALAADVGIHVVCASMHVCGTRSMTGELALHRFYRLIRLEATRFGSPDTLWTAVGRAHPLSHAGTSLADRICW